MHIPLPTLSRSLAPLSAALDAATPEQRKNWMWGLGWRQLRALWELAVAEGLPLDLDWLAAPAGTTVIHAGQNSLPAFVRFEKRFYRDPETGAVQGYNHNGPLVGRVTGPGHFTVRAADPRCLHIDYTVMPPAVPDDFPALKDNESGTAKLVFGNMVDHLRRVSTHCSIGRGVKGGQDMSAWFMLTRTTDPPAATGSAAS
jgi:hypothetical protein